MPIIFIVGVTVDFTLPELLSGSLFARGIGLTVFEYVRQCWWDIVLVLSMRKPGVLPPFIAKVAEKLVVRIYSDELVPKAENVTVHQGRVMFAYLVDCREDWVGLCVGWWRTVKTFPYAHS